MPEFVADSSLVERVVPSPNLDDAQGGDPDMILLHYTGMQTADEALERLRDPEARVSSHYFVLRERQHRADGAGGEARLARRRVVVGRRDRHQFALDRHRDRQSRPRLRLSGLSDPADRRGDRAVPRHHRAPRHHAATACWRIPTWRRAASRIRARNFPGGCSPNPASACGSSRCRSPTGCRCVPGDTGETVTELQKALADFGYGVPVSGDYDEHDQGCRHRVPAPFPAGAGRRHGRHLDPRDAAQAARSAQRPPSSPRISPSSPKLAGLDAARLAAPHLSPSVGWTAAPAITERWPGRKVRAPRMNGAG